MTTRLSQNKLAAVVAALQARGDSIPPHLASLVPTIAMAGSEQELDLWLAQRFGHILTSRNAPRHDNLLRWFDDITVGNYQPPRVEIWSRGGGKSQAYEIGITRCGIKLSRRFALIVSDTQGQADSHVQSIGALLEAAGAEPAINRFGRAKGWRRDQLRTKNGFSVAGFGVDAGQRGIRIEEFRPDFICFDDCDSRHDSLDAVIKKIECITQTIMPTGSADCIYLWIENMIHSNSISAQLVDERADFLLNRDIATVEKAVNGLQVEMIPRPGRKPLYKVVAGTATWEGQNLDIVEKQINDWGYETFLRESQHEVRAGSAFFDQYENLRHRKPALFTPHNPPPRYWKYYIGIDDGYDDPFAAVLIGVDTKGKVHGMDCVQNRRFTNVQKCEALALMLETWHLDKEDVTCGYDETMRNRPQLEGVTGESSVEVFLNNGFIMVPVRNALPVQTSGFMYIRELLRIAGDPSPAIEFWSGFTDKLTVALENATHDKRQPEKINHDGSSHLVQSLRYAIAMRPEAGEEPREDAENAQVWYYPGPGGSLVKAVVLEEKDLPEPLRSPVNYENGMSGDYFDPFNPGWG